MSSRDRHPDGRQREQRSLDDRARRIVDVLVALGPGEVTTYGDVAEDAGLPGRSRLVGRLLATVDWATVDLDVPWWRVVTAAGRLAPGHEREQAALLRAEDVVVRSGRVVAAPVGRFSRPSGPGRPARRTPPGPTAAPFGRP